MHLYFRLKLLKDAWSEKSKKKTHFNIYIPHAQTGWGSRNKSPAWNVWITKWIITLLKRRNAHTHLYKLRLTSCAVDFSSGRGETYIICSHVHKTREWSHLCFHGYCWGICMFDSAVSFIEAITGERVRLVKANPSFRCFNHYKSLDWIFLLMNEDDFTSGFSLPRNTTRAYKNTHTRMQK